MSRRPTEDEIRAAATTYAAALDSGDPHPIKAVTTAMDISRATAHRWINRARTEGILARLGDHEPRRVRWSTGGASWLACYACRHPWPCPNAPKCGTCRDAPPPGYACLTCRREAHR